MIRRRPACGFRGAVPAPLLKEHRVTFRTLTLATALAMAATNAFAQAPAPAAAPAAQAPAQPQLGPNQWNIDPNHSTAGFTVTHLMVSTVPGSFGKMTGLVTYDGKDVSTIAADVTIDATSINTNNERRDTHLKSPDFFEVAKYPTLTFKSKKVVPAGAGKFQLVGDLTMRGVTKEVTFDVEGPTQVVNAGRNFVVGANATTKIKRSEWGLTWNRAIEAGGVTVSDEVKITLGIEANKPNPNAPPPPPRPGQ
jgi:polyisoprenoid-binding protein YceI